MLQSPISLIPLVLAFAGALALTPVVRAAARRRGIVARPMADRWHKQPTALLGGVAVFATVAAVQLLFVPRTAPALVVLGASAFLFVVGLVDDFRALKPYQKLIGQVMGAAVVVSQGLSLPWTASATLNMAITIIWLVGITNAVNLLDNMDGLAAGVAAIASVFLTVHFLREGQAAHALMLAVFAATLLGFLVYNTNPASIFMGDCGSLFIGFFLASATLLVTAGGRTSGILPVLAVPVLILFIPIFDTLFVMVLRKLAGRAVSRGGRDHTSHRLVALGLSERRAVLMLYAFATIAGLLGLLVRGMATDVSLAAILGFTVALTLLGVHLANVKVYDDAEVAAALQKPLMAFFVDLSYKRRVFEVILDLALIVLAYHVATVLVFGPIAEAEPRQRFLAALPILIVVKLGAFLGAGVYRGLWRYMSVDDLVILAKAVLAGSVVSVVVLLFAVGFEGFSRVVFVLDGLILLMMAAISRMTFRAFGRHAQMAPRSEGRRVLIYGAGDAGELLARALLDNRALRCVPVGFADDDPHKKGKLIHGLPVLGGNGSFLAICREHAVDDVLISSAKLTRERLEQIAHDCRAGALVLKRMRIHLEYLRDDAKGEPATAGPTERMADQAGAIPQGLKIG